MAQIFELEGGIKLDVSDTRDPKTIIQASQAASLKRIADYLRNPYDLSGITEQLALWRLQDAG